MLRSSARRWLPSRVSDELLVAGLRGVLHQIALWYLGRDNASDSSQQALSISAAQARILRNEMHNLSLAREIEARSQHDGTVIEALTAFRTFSSAPVQSSGSSKLN
jgi:hypothetical protein